MWSSSSNIQWIRDVFLSFRGEDTRNTFVSHLYAALSNAGVNTFIDDTLRKGADLRAELVRTINHSQISIVVFSTNYASSKWCLDELVEIMECRRTYGQVVVPVFYNVDPSDVRHQTGAFGERFEELMQKCSRQCTRNRSVLNSWETAITEAANIAGWDARNRNERHVVNEIVTDILHRLDIDYIPIPEFSVGIKSRVEQVMDFINGQSGRACVVGIWGMGGSGKTTLARAIYNQIRLRFIRRSFIETSNRGHIDLQEKLLSDVLKTKVTIHSIEMGKAMIEKKLCTAKALIVLDDVIEFEQLKALCGNRKWIAEGSVIIITTRDVRLLNLFKADHVYKVEEMNVHDSLKLFRWHAFREAEPSEDFNKLAKKVVAYCGGLSLALEVLGSYLTERKKKEWESVLLKLENIPDDQVQEKLRISFDGLRNDMEKDIFLDVCCFFIGKDRAYVTDILNGCELCADIGITVLIERSLLKVERKNKLGMHPLLRAMGREIIRERSRKELGKRSRLWFHKDVVDVLTKNSGTEAIEGLALKLDFTSKDCFKAHAFEEMKRLRLLQLDYAQLTGDYGYLSKKLRWISWQGYPSKYIPNNFNLNGTIVMDLKHSSLRVVWKEPQVLRWLKILNLSHSKYLTQTPNFSKLPSLEKLILKHCPSLCNVHQSIGDLHKLVLINLKGCTSLGNLPTEVYKLQSVQTLILSGCSNIDKLEEDIVQMKSLTTLIAEDTAVKQVPFSIVSSKSIGYISLCGFEGLSRNVFPSIIRSWMSPTMNPLSYISPFCSTSSSLVSVDLENNDWGDLVPLLSNLSNLRSVLMQCDTQYQLSKQLRTILDDVYAVNFTESEISMHHLRSYLIGIGYYEEVFNTLNDSISKGLATSDSCDDFLPVDNDLYCLAHMGEGHSVYFTVPDDCCIKGMTLCVIYSSTPELMPSECVTSVLIVNYTQCTIQIHKRDTVISFNDADWQVINSHLGAGDKVEIFVTFGHKLLVKKTAVYLIYGESNDKEVEPSSEPKKKMKKKTFVRFIKKIVTCKTQEE